MWERRNWWVFITAVVCLLGLTACQSTPQKLEYVGRVIDAETLRPVPNAQVSFSFVGAPPVAYTDSNGVYTFLVPIENEPVSGRITILADGYEPFVLNVSLRTDTLTIQDVRLQGVVTGNVVPSAVAVAVAEVTATATATPSHTPTSEPTNTPTIQPANTPQPTNTPTATATATPNPNIPPANAQAGDPWVRPADNMTMRFVPSGTFSMGHTNISADESPIHDVTLDSFWIDQTEVTNAQYAKCVQDSTCRRVGIATEAGYNGADQPVTGIRWDNAQGYCEWAGGRLPTEAEWEYAARGKEGYTYPWGNIFDGEKANFCDENCTFEWRNGAVNDQYEFTAPVGTYSPAGDSWVRAQDMAGNVWEWVSDWYGSDYYAQFVQDNPTGPERGSEKVLRGGSWFNGATDLRSANRYNLDPTSQYYSVGFRCVFSSP